MKVKAEGGYKKRKNPYKEVLEYLENTYSGARMMNDFRLQVRLSRAILAFKVRPEEDLIDTLIKYDKGELVDIGGKR